MATNYRLRIPDLTRGYEAYQNAKANNLAKQRQEQLLELGEIQMQEASAAAMRSGALSQQVQAEKAYDQELARVGFLSQVYLNLPDDESKEGFLRDEVARLNAAGKDYSDTLELLSMPIPERDNIMNNGFQAAAAAGYAQRDKLIPIYDTMTGIERFVSEGEMRNDLERFIPVSAAPKSKIMELVDDETGEKGQYIINSITGEKQRLGGIVDKDKGKFDKAKVFRAEIQKKQKDFTDVTNAFDRVSVAAANPSPAGDLAIVFNFMKMLDPGSVVRESEFKTAADAKAWLGKAEESGISIPNKIRSIILKAQEGQILLPEQREDFLKTAGNLYKSTEKKNKIYRKRKSKQAQRFGLEEADIFLMEGLSDLKTSSDADILGAL